MSVLHFRRIERRRTTRATVCMNLLVYGETDLGDKFRYWTRSVSVSAHGGVLLQAQLAVGQQFHIVNEFNGKKATAKIVAVRNGRDGLVHASFEFLENAEKFWSMQFPAAGAKPMRRMLPRAAQAYGSS